MFVGEGVSNSNGRGKSSSEAQHPPVEKITQKLIILCVKERGNMKKERTGIKEQRRQRRKDVKRTLRGIDAKTSVSTILSISALCLPSFDICHKFYFLI